MPGRPGCFPLALPPPRNIMKNFLRILAALVAAYIASPQVCGAEAAALTGLNWHGFPDPAKFSVRGLPWFAENSPKFWRMPGQAMESLPKGVQGRSKCPSGGRIVMRSTTSRLAVRAAAVNGGNVARFDAYVNGRAFHSVTAGKSGAETELVLFEGLGGEEKDIVVYLPHLQEVVVTAIGVDDGHVVPGAGTTIRPTPAGGVLRVLRVPGQRFIQSGADL